MLWIVWSLLLGGDVLVAPLEMTATGGLFFDLKNKLGRAEGDVVIRRADLTVCCDRAEARYGSGGASAIERVECQGRVVMVRNGGTRARANTAIFEAQNNRMTLLGAARVQSATADLFGETIVYEVGTERLEVRGAASRFTYSPGASPPFAFERPCPPPP